MIREIYGKKIGMTQLFNEEGELLGVTLLEVEPVCVLEKVEYASCLKAKIGVFQLEGKKVNRLKKPQESYFKKLETPFYRLVREVALEEGADFSFKKVTEPIEAEAEQTEGLISGPEKQSETNSSKDAREETNAEKESAQEVQGNSEHGQKEEPQEEAGDPRMFGVEIFNEGEIVDIRAKSKGKGFAGGMKRHNWSGQPSSHGHTMHRRPGSIGASASPSKVIKGRPMPGHLGNAFITIKNLKILKIDKEKNLLFVKGGIPGARGSVVRIKKI